MAFKGPELKTADMESTKVLTGSGHNGWLPVSSPQRPRLLGNCRPAHLMLPHSMRPRAEREAFFQDLRVKKLCPVLDFIIV